MVVFSTFETTIKSTMMKFNVSVDRWNIDKKGASPVFVWVSFGAQRFKSYIGERIAWRGWDDTSAPDQHICLPCHIYPHLHIIPQGSKGR